MRLLEALRKIEEERLISFHMPGHKNNPIMTSQLNHLMALDITEIPGADHLHDAQDCILETQNKIQSYYSSYQSRLIINGSTAGILSMIMGVLKPGEGVLINRNAHKSIYNAIEMGRLEPYYFWPTYEDSGLVIHYDFQKFKELIMQNKKIKAVVLTYPTYEGICYEIKAMIDLCHEQNLLVLVDEAHGAHLKTFDQLPVSALDYGADVVVQSFHKTLPAMTQTACLHFGHAMKAHPELIERVDYYLGSIQTSSPSYPLMASVDAMFNILEKDGQKLNQKMLKCIKGFYEHTQDLKTMHFVHYSNQDFYKLILQIDTDYYIPGVWDGHVLSIALRTKHQIQVEYDQPLMLLFMSSLCNVDENFERLNRALHILDQKRLKLNQMKKYEGIKFSTVFNQIEATFVRVYLPEEAKLLPYEYVTLDEALGQISADYLIPYPPGIPICVPGERIDETMLMIYHALLKNMMGSKHKIKIIERSPDTNVKCSGIS